MTTLYQFCVDGRAAGPRQHAWSDAARDAVNAGYATWVSDGDVALADGASIERINITPVTGN